MCLEKLLSTIDPKILKFPCSCARARLRNNNEKDIKHVTSRFEGMHVPRILCHILIIISYQCYNVFKSEFVVRKIAEDWLRSIPIVKMN